MDDQKGDQNKNKSLEDADQRDMVRKHLKVLLLHLAARSNQPGADLESLLHEVIEELHQEVKEALETKQRLRLVVNASETMN